MPPPSEPLHRHHHAVQFYQDEVELSRTIATFLSEGLAAGQPAIVIATPGHEAAIVEALTSHLIDVPRARHLGDLVMLDAEDTLGTFMNKGVPDQVLFQNSIGDLIVQTVRGRGRMPIRAYGEMVDVLWQRGEADAAIRLEVLWNELTATHAFSLLCGYAIGHFYKQTAKIDDICRQHTHVIGTNVVPFDAAHQARA